MKMSSKAEQMIHETLVDLQKIEEGKTLHDMMHDSHLAGPLLQQTLYSICRHYERLRWILKCDGDKIRPRHLRLGCWVMCQHLYLSSMPSQKAASIAIDVANKIWHKREASFLNSLFRKKISIAPDQWIERIEKEAPPWVKYDLSEAIWQEWSQQFPEEKIAEMAQDLALPPKVTLRLRQGQHLPEELQTMLQSLPPLPWAPQITMWQIEKSECFFKHPLFNAQSIYCQDPTTLAAPFLLDAKPEEIIADLCCAPGGKTALMAENMMGKGEIWCCDRSEKRLSVAKQNLEIYGGLCHFSVQDATAPNFPPNKFDAILLDVPCSNSGVLRRHPDVRLHYSLANVEELILLQAEILRKAAPLLKKGGRLIYSTCSINYRENQAQILNFLEANPKFTLEKEWNILPAKDFDGGYAAKLVRNKE